MRLGLLGLAAALALSADAATAGEAFVGVYAHDLSVFALGGYEDGAQVAVGYRTDPLRPLHALGSPSVYGFGAANTAGGVNYAAAGLSWRIGERLFLRPGLGVAVQGGEAHKFQEGNTLNLGSRVLAELELGLGWQINPRTSVEGSFVHLSHGQLAGRQNPGLDDVGLRFAFRF